MVWVPCLGEAYLNKFVNKNPKTPKPQRSEFNTLKWFNIYKLNLFNIYAFISIAAFEICSRSGHFKSVLEKRAVDGRIFAPRFWRFDTVDVYEEIFNYLKLPPVSGPVLVDKGLVNMRKRCQKADQHDSLNRGQRRGKRGLNWKNGGHRQQTGLESLDFLWSFVNS